MYKDINLEALNREFNDYQEDSDDDYYGRRNRSNIKKISTIFTPLKVSLQCKLMQKVLPLVVAEDPAETTKFH